VTITAFFDSKQTWRWRGPRTLDLTTRVSAPGFRFRGRTLVAYLARGRTFTRLGAARLSGGRAGRGTARIRIVSPPKARRKDFVVYCIANDGSFGRRSDPVNRRCGAARIRA
jgi:hypothetical protein